MPNLFVCSSAKAIMCYVIVFVQDIPSANLLQKQEEQVQRTLLFALIPVVIAFSFFVFIFYRSRREAFFKQRETELKLNVVEGELKALRAQVNPHFIFNCLNSIHHCIHSGNPMAGDYLIKFSALIRHALESSSMRMVPLADEINANILYLQLEQLRLNRSFEYIVEADPSIDTDKVHIPPMIIQPFVENSIWHGINQRSADGKIDVRFSFRDEKHIQCIVADNGMQGEKPDYDLSQVVKKTSMGMSLIRDRLEMLNTLHQSKAGFEINEAANGKSVTIILPFED